MSTKHTPGPWEICNRSDDWTHYTIESIGIGRILDTEDQSNEPYANALLIAAAPDLLETLRQAYAALEKAVHFEASIPFWRKGGDGYSAMLDSRAAILKATQG